MEENENGKHMFPFKGLIQKVNTSLLRDPGNNSLPGQLLLQGRLGNVVFSWKDIWPTKVWVPLLEDRSTNANQKDISSFCHCIISGLRIFGRSLLGTKWKGRKFYQKWLIINFERPVKLWCMLATIKLNRNNTQLRHLVWMRCTPPATGMTPLSSLLWGHFIWDKVSLCISNWHGTY